MVWSKDTRRKVWIALRRDDPELLAETLQSEQEIRDGCIGLWNPKKYRTQIGKRDTHLLDVMLLQKTGVNYGKGGALRCYTWLISAFPNAYTLQEKESVLQRYHHYSHGSSTF